MNAFEQAFQDEISFAYMLSDRIRLIGVLRNLEAMKTCIYYTLLSPDSQALFGSVSQGSNPCPPSLVPHKEVKNARFGGRYFPK